MRAAPSAASTSGQDRDDQLARQRQPTRTTTARPPAAATASSPLITRMRSADGIEDLADVGDLVPTPRDEAVNPVRGAERRRAATPRWRDDPCRRAARRRRGSSGQANQRDRRSATSAIPRRRSSSLITEAYSYAMVMDSSK